MGKINIYGVAGKPILHSRSPELFSLAYPGSPTPYLRISSQSIEDLIFLVQEIGIKGLNITSPFKEEVLKLNKIKASPEVKATGAANTLIFRDSSIEAHNTDFDGVLNPIKEYPINPQNLKTVVIGAGGAAKAAVHSLKNLGADITVLNRTLSKAINLANSANCKYQDIRYCSSLLKETEMVISTIPTEHFLQYIENIGPDTLIFDAVYGGKFSSEIGSVFPQNPTISGFQWLINQGITSYRLMTGKVPDRDSIKEKFTPPFPPFPKRIAITGFMGAGKTRIARDLASKKGYTFIDLDREIEKRQKSKISDIFKKAGEPHFRNLETEALEELSKKENTIIACGGGVVEREVNRKILKKQFTSIWVYSSLSSSFKRDIVQDRPLLNVDHPFEAANTLLQKRIPLYATSADLLVSNESSLKSVVEKIDEETG